MNQQQKMEINSDHQLSEKYIHQLEARSLRQQMLSDNLGNTLSELNFKRIRETQPLTTPLKNSYFFLCITGLPPNPSQFLSLNLPGEVQIYTVRGLQRDTVYTDDQYQQILQTTSIQTEADNIAEIIRNVKDKKVVLVYHSFGGFVVSAYSHYYRGEGVVGLIDVGAIPITMYTLMRDTLIKYVQGIGINNLLANPDYHYGEYIKQSNIRSALPLKNKYQFLIFMKILSRDSFKTILECARNLPKIIKLFLFGKKDIIFTNSQFNEKVIHYCYVNTIEGKYAAQISKNYQKMYGKMVKNAQERFIFNFEEGKHSLHLQKKLTTEIQRVIWDYLQLIDGREEVETRSSNL